MSIVSSTGIVNLVTYIELHILSTANTLTYADRSLNPEHYTAIAIIQSIFWCQEALTKSRM